MSKIRNVFSFLKEYNELLNPVIREIDKQNGYYKLSNLPQIKEVWSIYKTRNLNSLKILEVKRPDIESCSSSQVDLPKKQGLDLYNKLFKLYSHIKRESESVELILADGHIRWKTKDRYINHPVLLQKVKLEFNPDIPSFIIKCDELKTELYTSMLRTIPSINQSMLSDMIKEAANIKHIADKENNIEFFKRLINVVDKNGKYLEDLNNDHNGPVITYDPVLYLRKRTLGYSAFIENIIEDIDNEPDKEFPQFFQNMVGEYKEQERNDEHIGEDWNYNGIDEDTLLTLPANNEQLKVMKSLDKHGAVLVQGPPGTGKTHTIANLIGHLLSKGKSVLVTSQTEKALTVLKDMVYKELQSLCVSILSTSSQQKEVEESIFEMDEKNTTFDLNDSHNKIEQLEIARKELIEIYKSKNEELKWIRNLNYKDINFADENIKPIEAAKFINSGKGIYDYIPGESNDYTLSIPLSNEELHKLYKSNEIMTTNEERLLGGDLPNFTDLWESNRFDLKVKEIQEYEGLVKDWTAKFKVRDDVDKSRVLELSKEAENIVDSLDSLEGFQLYIMNRTIIDNTYYRFWEQIFREYNKFEKDYEKYKSIIFKNNYKIPEEIANKDNMIILDQIIETAKAIPISTFVGLTKPKWRKLQRTITNSDKVIEKIHEYEDVRFISNYERKRNEFLEQIKKLLGEYGKDLDLESQDIELKLKVFIEKVEIALDWYENKWSQYISKIKDCLKKPDTVKELFTIDMSRTTESIYSILKNTVIEELKNNYYSIQFKELKDELDSYLASLKEYKINEEPFNGLLRAIEEKNIKKYKAHYTDIKNLYHKKEIYHDRIKLLNELKNIAPNWAEAIKTREGIHGNSIVPEDIELAWKWNQLNSQINKINSYDQNAIQREMDHINELVMRNARKLAYEKAWYNKIRNTTDEQTQAIRGWMQTMKQVGKGTGKNAPKLLKKARDLMASCQTAIPAWIMPLNRVAENFDPKRNEFDVVIIDEASQADLLSLSTLYLGKKIIIVGDDEQVSPNPVGIPTNEINALIDQYLQDIPLNHLYNGQTSIYDMAQNSGFQPLMLTEHFRCLPEIIEFSNQLSYNGKIKPLRDASQVRVTPAVIPYKVPGNIEKSSKVNKVEAEHIAALICACIENEEYAGKTVGVISLSGKEQADQIDKLLQAKLDPTEYEGRRIQCGVSAQFQGDERDIIFLSLVEDPNKDGSPVRLISQSGKNEMNRKSYNVAASRAKDQMWVVYSLDPKTDLKPGDIRLRLIKHALNPSYTEYGKQIKYTESDFERKVMKALQQKGYKVHTQWKVGSYNIDMVVEDGNKHIAIECDGDHLNSLYDLPTDMKRQAVLERLGWRFIRIRGSQYYKDPKETMEWVFNQLENYEIKANSLDMDETNTEEDELLKRIKTRSEEIRMK